VVVGLAGGEVIYFELDATGALSELDKKDLGLELSCLELGAVPTGRARSRFAAAGGYDNTIRILSLDPDECMNVLSVLALPAQAESAALARLPLGRPGTPPALFLCIGLSNGVMLRARIDERSGQLSDTRTRFLGAKPARLFRLPLGGADGVLALSSRAWVLYSLAGGLHTTPLSYVPLDAGAPFSSEHCAEGIVREQAHARCGENTRPHYRIYPRPP
jgi:splicing factor 3B subunit 3